MGSLIWLAIVFTIFIIGYILNKTRKNIFTVAAAVLVLPIAQYSTQLITIWKFKDPDSKTSERLEQIKGEYNLFHSVLVPAKNTILYFDHIIVTGSKLYCIVNEPKDMNNIKTLFNDKINSKGIPQEAIVYLEQNKATNMGNVLKQIEKNVALEDEENLKDYTHLIGQMMM